MGQMRNTIVSTVLLAVINTTPTVASLPVSYPASICAFLNNIGLSTGGWKNIYGSEFGCHSPYKDIGADTPLTSANNLAYYVDGDKASVNQAKLVLNVNNRSQATSAHSALLAASEELCAKISGTKLAINIRDAIVVGKPFKSNIGNVSVEIIRSDWPTGKGYELHVVFK